jgi:hypothetical protein
VQDQGVVYAHCTEVDMRFFRWLFGRSEKICCPVCGSVNHVAQPFHGRDDQGVIGYDRQFACGFKSSWRGHRVALCSAEHPVPVAQAISQIAEASRPRPQLVNGHHG